MTQTNPKFQAALSDLLEAYKTFKADGNGAGAERVLAQIAVLNEEASKSAGRIVEPTASFTGVPEPGATSATDGTPLLSSYIRNAVRNPAAVQGALTIGDTDTAHAVPVQLAAAFNTVLVKRNVFRDLAHVVQTSSDKFEEMIGQGNQTASIVAEADARPATTPVTFKIVSPAMTELYVNVPMSQRLIEDAAIDVGAYVVEEAARQFGATESSQIVNGTGVSPQVKGVLAYTLAAAPVWGTTLRQVKSGVAGVLSYDTLVDLTASLPVEYRQGAAFVASPSAISALRKLKDSQARPLWTGGLGATPGEVLGFPTAECADLPAVGTSSNSIIFGNWDRAVLIADRMNLSVLVDPYSSKPYVNAYCRHRVGMTVRDFNALTVYTLGV